LKIKRAIKTCLLLVAATALAHVLSALTLDRSIQYKRVPFYIEKVGPGLEDYTIVFISDTHAMTAAQLRTMVES